MAILQITTPLKAVRIYANSDPGVTDDQYEKGSVWVNTSTNTLFILASSAAAAAVWIGVGSATLLADHSARHENGGADEISVAGLSGLLADAQTPAPHTHPKSEIDDAGTWDAAEIPNLSATKITTDTLDGDRLPAISATKKGGVPATGAPLGLFLKDDGTWAAPAGGSGLTDPQVIARVALGVL